MASQRPPFKRILLKLSGEALNSRQEFGLSEESSRHIALAIKEIYDLGLEIAIVIGGGNIFRGSDAKKFGLLRTPADHVGMLATIINGIIFQQSLANQKMHCRVMSAKGFDPLVETYRWPKALEALEKDRLLIFVGGTGSPYFSTDTAAALRACEMNVQILFKATKVDGIYSDDPIKNPKAKKYNELSYSEALAKKLKVMDLPAFAMCRENQVPIYIFNLFEKRSLFNAVCKLKGGSLISGE